jgi:HSP20 family protein
MKIIKRQSELPVFDQLFEGLFRDEPSQWMKQNQWNQRKDMANIIETEDAFEIEVMAPGYRKEDLSIDVVKRTLTLKAQGQKEDKESPRKYLRREFHIQNLERRFTLPEGKILEDEIKANFQDGILMVRLPKNKEASQKERRMIEIN